MKVKNIVKEIKAPNYHISPENFENIFNVYDDEGGNHYYNLLRTVDFPDKLDEKYYTTYTTGRNEHYTNISYWVYGTTKLWWLITGANHIMDPTYPPDPGTKLKIIIPSMVNDILAEIESQLNQ